MGNIILVAGTYHGGWYWNPILNDLTSAGHRVFTPTLSGLDPEVPITEPINLDTHIDDVLRVIDENQLTEVVLVGWSYGGMVITGVIDRTTAAITKAIYLDAQLPKSGQREWDLMPDRDDWVKLCADGVSFFPDEWLQKYEPRAQPHPVGTKLQPLTYDQAKFDSTEKLFIYAEKWFHEPSVVSPLKVSFELASSTPGWRVQVWPFGHDLVREAAPKLAEMLISEA